MARRTVVLRKDRFDEREADFYEAMYTQSQAQFDAYVDSGTLLNNYSHVFDLLIKLRQVRSEAWALPQTLHSDCSDA
jgi:DNA repair protein RAD16